MDEAEPTCGCAEGDEAARRVADDDGRLVEKRLEPVGMCLEAVPARLRGRRSTEAQGVRSDKAVVGELLGERIPVGRRGTQAVEGEDQRSSPPRGVEQRWNRRG